MKAFLPRVLGLLLCLLSSCMWEHQKPSKPDITSDTLRYQYRTFKQRAKDCGDKPDSACTVIKITYPVFVNQYALNDTARHRAAILFAAYNQTDTSFKSFAGKFMKAYEQDMVNRNVRVAYTVNTEEKVVRQDSSLLVMQLSGYSFQGGAHGSYLMFFINWNTKQNKNIDLQDILIDGFKPKLDSIAEQIFRKSEKLSATESLKTNYFFTKDIFSLNDNYQITPTGLRFLYNEYEIQPYAAGRTELFIPYAQIKGLLKPNTVISQYIN